MSTDIRTYIRNSKKQPIGIIIATTSNHPDHKYHIGWSKVHAKKDKFDKRIGLAIAIGRINKAEQLGVTMYNADVQVPQRIAEQITHFDERCKRYFK